jgi:hypothetical protein
MVGSDMIIDVEVKNLAFEKEVTIVYTTDDWATVKTYPLEFQELYANGTELWSADFIVTSWDPWRQTGRTPLKLEYCIAYDVNGMTYWDNNGGENYVRDIAYRYLLP